MLGDVGRVVGRMPFSEAEMGIEHNGTKTITDPASGPGGFMQLGERGLYLLIHSGCT